jgi:hypothetical protein
VHPQEDIRAAYRVWSDPTHVECGAVADAEPRPAEQHNHVKAGLRQVDMARALGKPQAFVSYYESGARRLDLLELRQICGILGVPLVDLVRKFEKLLQ